LVSGGIYLLVCGRFGTTIARHRGRSLLEGFLLGGILGPIGIAMESVMPRCGGRKRARNLLQEESEFVRRLTAWSREPLGEVDERRPRGGPEKRRQQLAAATITRGRSASSPSSVPTSTSSAFTVMSTDRSRECFAVCSH
jgi:hypothetical protein